MYRDWSAPVFKEDKGKYSATIRLEKNVVPVYAWFNGRSRMQLLEEQVARQADGSVGIVVPEGSRADPGSRIHAFKLHRGKLPVLAERQWLVPIVVEQFFADGNIDHAVREAAALTYGVKDTAFAWVDTIRYMGLFHEVQPKGEALECLDCHRPEGRLDWAALGYDGDPLEKRLGR
jgi:hypothetical protein